MVSIPGVGASLECVFGDRPGLLGRGSGEPFFALEMFVEQLTQRRGVPLCLRMMLKEAIARGSYPDSAVAKLASL